VLPTGANPDHFDVQLVPGRDVESGPADLDTLIGAAARLLDIAGDLQANPAYAGDEEKP
jgi:hypothetical protein